MKSFIAIVILALFGVVNCGEAGKEMKFEGCEKAADFKDLTPQSCCESYASLHSKDHMQCKSTCSAITNHLEKKCCWTNCTLTMDKLLNANGQIDNEKLIAYLNEKFNKPEWTEPIKKTVEECLKEAPEMLNKFKEKFTDVKCDGAPNVVMKHCVMRNLFFNCPAKTTSQQCTDYEQFAKGCPMFPHCGGKRGGKDDKKKDEEE